MVLEKLMNIFELQLYILHIENNSFLLDNGAGTSVYIPGKVHESFPAFAMQGYMWLWSSDLYSIPTE